MSISDIFSMLGAVALFLFGMSTMTDGLAQLSSGRLESILEKLTDLSCGNDLSSFWRLFERRQRARNRLSRWLLNFLTNRSAHRHGGYIGPGASFKGRPSLPHGLHGVFISRYASIGAGCRIYQNVTIGEVDGKAPRIGDHCLIGAGACLIGDITIGDNVRIGAGAVVAVDLPSGCTAVAQTPRIIVRG